MNQNEPERRYANPEPATVIHDQFLLTVTTIRQVLTILLLTKRLYLLGHFEYEFHILSI